MDLPAVVDLSVVLPLAPLLAMALPLAAAWSLRGQPHRAWRLFHTASLLALAGAVAAGVGMWVGPPADEAALPGLRPTALGLLLAVLVQVLGTVIGAFAGRNLQGEPRQARFVAALAGVLAAVHLLLLADHWLLLIAAWAAVGAALQPLLCFYADRPFALLAAHKKRLADRLADVMLIVAAGLAWHEVGSGSLTALGLHLAEQGASPALQASALCLAVAVVLRTALLPVHGWLIQVMEAPTPVSALLHAGVVNLGGFVLIRFAPLLEAAPAARWLLLAFGLAAAVLAGMVMATRISIKVRLAWSTVAQMGFMVLECALGLYTLAALHLVGHSLYKAHAFLGASSVVRDTRLRLLRGATVPGWASLLLAPCAAVATVVAVQAAQQATTGHAAWPLWWSAVLGLAWAPLLWLPAPRRAGQGPGRLALAGLALAGLVAVAALAAVAALLHGVMPGLPDDPLHAAGPLVALAFAALHAWLVTLQRRPQALPAWRRWSYAGFYLDEAFTRLALRLWPARWTPAARAQAAALQQA